MQRKRRWTVAFVTAMTVVCVVGCWFWVRQAQRQYARNRQLIAALTKNDTKQALVLVNAGADPNTRFNPPPTPTLKFLLQQFLHRKPPSDNDSPTAFLLACGHKVIGSKNGEINSVDVQEDLPLERAMLAHGAKVNATTSYQVTALMSAAFERDPDTVALLLEHGAKVNAANAPGWTALMFAVEKSKEKNVSLLLAHGAVVNAQNTDGDTALHYAIIFFSSTDIIVQLMAHGADPNLPNKNGDTPLLLAQRQTLPDLVALLRGKR